MASTDDISIGKDKWIRWVEFDSRLVTPRNIDSLLEPSKPFWEYLETECVTECCGIHAFAFWPEDIKKAISTSKIENLEPLIATVIQEIRSYDDEVLVSSQLNQLIHRKVFLQLLEHIQSTIIKN